VAVTPCRNRRRIRTRTVEKASTPQLWTSNTALSDLAHSIPHGYLVSLGYGVLGTALAIAPLPRRRDRTRRRLRPPRRSDHQHPLEQRRPLAPRTTPRRARPRRHQHRQLHPHLVTLSVYTTITATGTLAMFRQRDT
jgi:hypothetical protein